MDCRFLDLFFSKKTTAATLLFIAALVFLRFVHLGADFPLGVTASGTIFTDEGWYSNAAVRDVVSGTWYIPGDFNPMINMPVGQLLQRMDFGFFGLSLISARILGVVSYSAVIILSGLFMYRAAGRQAALLTALLLGSNFAGFAYSRIAIMEPVGMALLMGSLCAAQFARGKGTVTWLLIASLLLGDASLAKLSMLFAFPVIGYLAWLGAENDRDRWRFPLLAVLPGASVVIAWQLFAWRCFYPDYSYFDKLNFAERHVTSANIFENTIRQSERVGNMGLGLVSVALVLFLGASAVSPAFRRRPVVFALTGCFLTYLAMLCAIHYGPSRYFLPLVIPLAGLSSVAAIELTKWMCQNRKFRPWATVPSLFIAVIILSGSLREVTYLKNARYSELDMMQGVGQMIREQNGGTAGALVLGDTADTIAFEDQNRAVNAYEACLPVSRRLDVYHPQFLIFNSQGDTLLNLVRAKGGRPRELGMWDVFGNYYGERQYVHLYAVEWGTQVPAQRVSASCRPLSLAGANGSRFWAAAKLDPDFRSARSS